jgi:hypothetical protein
MLLEFNDAVHFSHSIFITRFCYASCGAHKIYVREQSIKAYAKSDGTEVSAHTRAAHCREIERSNYFQDSSNQNFTNIKPIIKKWNATDKRSIVIHEMSHIAFPSIDPIHKLEFIHASGWTTDSDFKPVAPQKLLMPDSKDSIDEDFANYLETFYKDEARLMTFNPLAFLIIKKIIDSKENEK